MIRTLSREDSQKTVGIDNDSAHRLYLMLGHSPMFFKNPLNGIPIQLARVPKPIGFFLYFLSIEFRKNIFEFLNALIRSAIVEHF